MVKRKERCDIGVSWNKKGNQGRPLNLKNKSRGI
jgi:hypothetical protein